MEKGRVQELGTRGVSDTSQDSQHCLKGCVTPGAFSRFLDPSPWLAGILSGSASSQREQAAWQWPGTPSPGAASRAEAQTENTWRSNEWRQELSLSQEEQVPNAAKECPMT